MIEIVPPAFIYFIGALVLPLVKNRLARQVTALIIPLIAFIDLIHMQPGVYWTYRFLDYELVLGRVDRLSMIFAYVFVIISFISMLYAIHIKETGQHVAAYFYVGSSLGVVFAGDLFTLFVCWELMAGSSVFLVWFNRTKASLDAGLRYVLVHLAGGCILMVGIVMHIIQTGSIAFSLFDIQTVAAKFILVGFIINAAVPPLHAWLPDAYPEGTITGSVFMTAFTTKSAVYVLARSFSGTEILVWLGAVMTIYGVIYAVLEKDLRRLLAYHIVSQVGYMVCGVGLGSEMAVNGASAHAFCHILYKALLFMGAGAVIHVTGRRKMTDLMGRNLYRKIPITLTLYMVGAFSISAVPLFNGFVSKTMIGFAAGALHRPAIELMLHLASIGTFLSVGLKLPWGTWFGKAVVETDDLPDVKEPPLNMILAMGLAAFLCLLTGVYPKLLYDYLPYPVSFHPYAAGHVVATLQLLILTLAGFWIYIDKIMAGKPAVTLDTDWFYRMFGRGLLRFCHVPLKRFSLWLASAGARGTTLLSELTENPTALVGMIQHALKGKTGSYQDAVAQHAGGKDNRFPIGWGVCASVLFLFFYGMVYLVMS
ncbi:Na(+)/H(+) antiporter subunit D [Thermodesulfobacteriota bacterium]